MAQFLVYTDGSGAPHALNVAHVKELFIGHLQISPTERWPVLFASVGEGVQVILRGEPDRLVEAMLNAVTLLSGGASAHVCSDGNVRASGETLV